MKNDNSLKSFVDESVFFVVNFSISLYFSLKYWIVNVTWQIDKFDSVFAFLSIVFLVYYFFRYSKIKEKLKASFIFITYGLKANDDGDLFPKDFIRFFIVYMSVSIIQVILSVINFIGFFLNVNGLNFTDFIDLFGSFLFMILLIIFYSPKKDK